MNFASLKWRELFSAPGHPRMNFLMIVAALFFFTMTGEFVTNIVGVVYPFVYSMNSLNENKISFMGNPPGTQHEKIVLMTKYWCIYGVLTMLDIFSGLPFYYHFKTFVLYSLIKDDFRSTQIFFDHIMSGYQKACIHWDIYRMGEQIKIIEEMINVVDKKNI